MLLISSGTHYHLSGQNVFSSNMVTIYVIFKKACSCLQRYSMSHLFCHFLEFDNRQRSVCLDGWMKLNLFVSSSLRLWILSYKIDTGSKNNIYIFQTNFYSNLVVIEKAFILTSKICNEWMHLVQKIKQNICISMKWSL